MRGRVQTRSSYASKDSGSDDLFIVHSHGDEPNITAGYSSGRLKDIFHQGFDVRPVPESCVRIDGATVSVRRPREIEGSVFFDIRVPRDVRVHLIQDGYVRNNRGRWEDLARRPSGAGGDQSGGRASPTAVGVRALHLQWTGGPGEGARPLSMRGRWAALGHFSIAPIIHRARHQRHGAGFGTERAARLCWRSRRRPLSNPRNGGREGVRIGLWFSDRRSAYGAREPTSALRAARCECVRRWRNWGLHC